MTTRKSNLQVFEQDQGPDLPLQLAGQLQFHETSGHVSWHVQGKERFLMSDAEFAAMLNANESMSECCGPPTPVGPGVKAYAALFDADDKELTAPSYKRAQILLYDGFSASAIFPIPKEDWADIHKYKVFDEQNVLLFEDRAGPWGYITVRKDDLPIRVTVSISL